ncbi:8752_t:CDS:2 [Funneliformis caledonium]|uniref:8752_t:CDS:1 n=1 Tax=Funneliformis caledonium TaxID=1117310 RepID=A0A9N9CM57_9GLOM|nr:8752_t:CDS:2 [Funneliformis caledonium]
MVESDLGCFVESLLEDLSITLRSLLLPLPLPRVELVDKEFTYGKLRI